MERFVKRILLVIGAGDCCQKAFSDLETRGYHLIQTSKSSDSIDLLQAGIIPEVILINSYMADQPEEMEQFFQQLNRKKLWSSIPVVVLSSCSASSNILKTLELGAIDYLLCPLQCNALVERICRAEEFHNNHEITRNYFKKNREKQPNVKQQLYKKTVDLMNLSLLYWESTTGKTKIELAEKSGLWTTYIDAKGTCTTKTLDRYLHLTTLPKKPRVRQVLATGCFVLQHCPENSLMKTQLQNSLMELEALQAKF